MSDDGGAHVPTLCEACARRLDLSEYLGTCTSFPDGIPEDIGTFGDDHRQSIAGEEPFELDPDRQEAFDDWLAVFGAPA